MRTQECVKFKAAVKPEAKSATHIKQKQQLNLARREKLSIKLYIYRATVVIITRTDK